MSIVLIKLFNFLKYIFYIILVYLRFHKVYKLTALCKYAIIKMRLSSEGDESFASNLWRYNMKGTKKFLIMLFTLASCLLVLSGCGNTKNISMNDVIHPTSLEPEPTNWMSDEAISTLLTINLPSELQETYMQLIRSGFKKVIMVDSEGWQATVSADENGVYVGNSSNHLKFFQSASGNIVEIGKVYRTLYRSEYFDGESQKAYNSIELDYNSDEASNLVKIAVTDDFSIMYNTLSNSYQCMQYGEVIGISTITNFDAAISPEKTPSPYGANKGFIYKEEIYIPVIKKDGEYTTFSIVKEADFNLQSGSFSYVNMKIGKLEVKACEVVVN